MGLCQEPGVETSGPWVSKCEGTGLQTPESESVFRVHESLISTSASAYHHCIVVVGGKEKHKTVMSMTITDCTRAVGYKQQLLLLCYWVVKVWMGNQTKSDS